MPLAPEGSDDQARRCRLDGNNEDGRHRQADGREREGGPTVRRGRLEEPDDEQDVAGEKGGQARDEQVHGEHQQDVAGQAAAEGGHEPPAAVDQVGVAGGDDRGGRHQRHQHRRLGGVLEPPVRRPDGQPVDDGGDRRQGHQRGEGGHLVDLHPNDYGAHLECSR